ncbi:MAG: AbrB/MazE/SpoVT family DNA-binding domain-containing protein [Longimicrobiales bacterium]|nr:AbrB/MazE/SpoVT family DNA-binding domain-containing protein [Longimicrobiales bacterium]
MTRSGAEGGAGSPPRRAKLFWNGRSQAVRLPKEFRFVGDAVEIRREGSAVILEPVKEAEWPEDYWDWVAGSREGLEIGDVEGLGVGFLDVGLDDE